MKERYKELEAFLIPVTDEGNIDFDSMDIKDHQHIAYCLKAEARLGRNKKFIRELTQYLVDHSDDNKDGEIGWGLGYAWNGFSANNPEWHVYAIEIANVIDAYIDALNSGKLSSELSEKVKVQLHDITILWNQKYWSETGNFGEEAFYWYSISKDDAIGCINIDAKMVGTQARLLDQYGEIFNEEEKDFIYDHIDRDYSKIMKNSYLKNGDLIWNYLEKKDSDPNDVIHHSFILEGIYDYQKFRIKGKPLNDNNYTSYVDKCIKDNMIYSTPEFLSERCFNTGAIRWILNKDVQRDVLMKSYDVYFNLDTNKRQLSFLLDAFSIFIANT